MAETAENRTALDGSRTCSKGRNQRILLLPDRERQASEPDDGRHGGQDCNGVGSRPDAGHPMGNLLINAIKAAYAVDGKELIQCRVLVKNVRTGN